VKGEGSPPEAGGSPGSLRKALPCAAFAAYLIVHFALMYQPGLIRMDDFGYLQGVVETIAAGRPHTNDWLEPYSAVVSGLGALAYGLTGDFILGTWGLQSLFVAAGALLLYRLFRTRLEPAAAAGMALLAATQPAYWHKGSEFSGNVFTMAFALGALLAYRHRRWAAFFPLAFLAFANRQNSMALLALPAFHLIFDRVRPGSHSHSEKAWIAAGMMVFACAALALHLSLNRSIAQDYGIYAGVSAYKAVLVLRTFLFGLLCALGFLSFFGILTGENPLARLRDNLRLPLRPWAPAAATLLLWSLPIIWSLPLMSFLTPLVGSLDRSFGLQWFLLLVLPCLFWTLDWKLIRFGAPAFLALAYVALSSLKGVWYDFYLVDVALAAFFLRLQSAAVFNPGRPAYALGALLLSLHFAWAYGYKIVADKQRISMAAYERLERAGRITPAEMTEGAFGYLGWKLFDQYWRHERITDMAAYLGYVRMGRVVVETELPWRRSFRLSRAGGGEVLEEGTARIGFFPARYRVRDLHVTGGRALCEPALSLDPVSYNKRPYPLNGKEWSAYVSAFPATPALPAKPDSMIGAMKDIKPGGSH
jgi:hypothetical protein